MILKERYEHFNNTIVER